MNIKKMKNWMVPVLLSSLFLLATKGVWAEYIEEKLDLGGGVDLDATDSYRDIRDRGLGLPWQYPQEQGHRIDSRIRSQLPSQISRMDSRFSSTPAVPKTLRILPRSDSALPANSTISCA